VVSAYFEVSTLGGWQPENISAEETNKGKISLTLISPSGIASAKRLARSTISLCPETMFVGDEDCVDEYADC
jgi:hypothetical protein